MAELTSRMQWPYPTEMDDPWFESFKSHVLAVDASGYAAREDRNIIVTGGGNFTFNSTTGVLTWAAAIRVFSPITGFLLDIAAGSVTLDVQGEIFYTTLTRAPTANGTISASTGMQIPGNDLTLLLGVRVGNRVYFRNGNVINGGETVQIFDSGSGASTGGPGGGIGASGERLRENVALVLNYQTQDDFDTECGGFILDVADYVLNGTSREFRFKVVGELVASTTGTVELVDLDTLDVLASLNITSLGSMEEVISAPLVLTGSHKLQVTARVANQNQPLKIWWAGLQIDNIIA